MTQLDRRLRALVIEDEWPARSFLVELLQSTSRVDVVAVVSTVAEAEQVLAAASPVGVDVAFVDVRLSGRRADESGLDWLRSVATGSTTRFVLATAFPQHALEAFQLGVVDYLLKPFTEERIAECVRRLESHARVLPTSEPQPMRVVARRGRALVLLEMGDVWACEASERVTYVHSARGRFDLDLTLSSIAASVGQTLVRVHRNWLVNVSRVLELGRDAEGSNALVVGAPSGPEHALVVPIARERLQAVRQLLLRDATGIRG